MGPLDGVVHCDSCVLGDLSGILPLGVRAVSLLGAARGVIKGVPANDGGSTFSPDSTEALAEPLGCTPSAIICCRINSRAVRARSRAGGTSCFHQSSGYLWRSSSHAAVCCRTHCSWALYTASKIALSRVEGLMLWERKAKEEKN
jgi:hypothetical protein